MNKIEIRDLISDGENVLWQGKPSLVSYVLGRIFSIGSVPSVFWMSYIFYRFGTWVQESGMKTAYLIAAILMYLFTTWPCWLYVGYVFSEIFAYGNIEYVVTNLGVYASGGVLKYSCKRCNFSDLQDDVKIRHGLFDFLFDTGNVALRMSYVAEHKGDAWTENEKAYGITIRSVKDFHEVYDLTKSLGWNTYLNGKDCNVIKPDEPQDGQKADNVRQEEWDWRQ